VKISFIIPSYNDSEQIASIVKAIQNTSYDKEIILVDDGSESKHKKIFQNLENIKLLTQSTNKGKSKAMETGFKNSIGDLIVFIDSDLIGLKSQNIKKLVDPVLNGKYDMTISKKEGGLSLYGTYTGFSQTFSGDRVIKRKLLEENISIFDVEGYSIEAEINKRFFKKCKIALVRWTNVANPSKFERHGLDGIIKDIEMNYQIQKHLGIKELALQLKFGMELKVL